MEILCYFFFNDRTVEGNFLSFSIPNNVKIGVDLDENFLVIQFVREGDENFHIELVFIADSDIKQISFESDIKKYECTLYGKIFQVVHDGVQGDAAFYYDDDRSFYEERYFLNHCSEKLLFCISIWTRNDKKHPLSVRRILELPEIKNFLHLIVFNTSK